MAYLLAEDQMQLTEILSTSHVETGGTLTNLLPIENVFERSRLREHKFTFTSIFNPKTLTINLKSTVDVKGLGILGMLPDGDVLSVKLFFNTFLITDCTQIVRELRNVGGKDVESFLWLPDNDVSGQCNKIEITWVNENTGEGFISNVFVGGALYEFKIEPDIDSGFKVIGEKERTLGGQVYGSLTGGYEEFRFRTVAKITQDHLNQSLKQINYKTATINPFVFFPAGGYENIFYGTQEKPFSYRSVKQKDPSGKWYQQLSFHIVEEF